MATLARSGVRPRTVIEPTCGEGAFLVAARDQWRSATLVGYELHHDYVTAARAALPSSVSVSQADFFATDWPRVFQRTNGPVLVLGNPPWVTSAELGSLTSSNLPRKENFKHLSGLDAITGKSNFDVSEWMLLRLLHALQGRAFVLSFLCKSIVARRVMEHAVSAQWRVHGETRAIDAMAHFGAAVDAVLLTVVSADKDKHADGGQAHAWPRYPSLDAITPAAVLGCPNGTATPDIDAFMRTRHLAGTCAPEWRSGLKHDCSAVMEFVAEGGQLRSRASGVVELESDYLFPMMKGSDVANGRLPPARAMLVTQRSLGQPTGTIQTVAPKTWRYLHQHRAALAARKSSIYAKQPAFAIFGVGDYTFAPWKVAIAGLYKKLSFLLVGLHAGKPVVFDDTTYFLPFSTEADARAAHEALTSPLAAEFFRARIFWDDKRPINKRVLQELDLDALQRTLGIDNRPRRPRPS
ncbi:hypothetical protein [Haliangium sp.]|uniref:hypothetical protein n=1 Tax=Haliangium sp. TaxID=2663208 RepID=UPI003D10B202